MLVGLVSGTEVRRLLHPLKTLAGPAGGTGGELLTAQKARSVMAEPGKPDKKQTIDTHNNSGEFQKHC